MKKKGLSLFLTFSLLAASVPVYGGELSDGSQDVYVETESETEEFSPATENILEDILSDGDMADSETENIEHMEEIPEEIPETGNLSNEEDFSLLEDGEVSGELSDGVDISELTGENVGAAGETAAISYSFDEETKTLIITGKGRMPDYSGQNMPPWSSYSSTAKKVVVEEGITYLGKIAFWEFDSAEIAVLPSTLKEIGTAAFGNCSSLTEVNLPEGLEKINDYAFQNAWVKSFHLPSTLKVLSNLFAWSCYAEEVTVAPENPYFTASEGVLFTKDMTKLVYYPRKRPGDSYTIPGTVKTVGENAFIKAAVRQVTIPSSVTKLESGCFTGSWIKSLVIPDSVTEVGSYICEECTELVNVQIGNGLTELGYRAFYGCAALNNVTFGKGLTFIDQLAFAHCYDLTKVTIPEGIKYIKNGAFGESGVTEIHFPSSLREIWYQAFLNCRNLTSVTFPEGVEVINRYSFYGTGIRSVTIPKTVTYIGEKAFPNGTDIKNLNDDLGTNEDGSMRVTYELPMKASYDYESAFKVLELTNKERQKQNRAPLTMDRELLDAAMKRAAETAVYFEHTRPDGSDCFSVSGKMSGENIAAGSTTAAYVVNNWMNSSGHRQNILNGSYHSLGVGAVVVNGVHYWVQAFGTGSGNQVDSSGYKNHTATAKIRFSIAGVTDSSDVFTFKIRGNSSVSVGESGNAALYVNNTFTDVPIDSQYITFKSQNPSVCKVSGNKYTGTGAGKTKITAALKSGSKDLASMDVTVAAKKIPVSELTIQLSPSEYTYNGGERRPVVQVYGKDGNAVSENNYTVTYPFTSKYPGTYTLKVDMKGNYYGSATKTYKIKKANQKVAVFDRSAPDKAISRVTKRLDSKTLTLGAKVTQGNKTGGFTFRSDNPEIASVTTWGKVTFKGVGKVKITAYTKGSGNYNSAVGTVTLTILPSPTVITKLQSTGTGCLNIQYRGSEKADGYQIQYSTSSDMKGAKSVSVNNRRTRSYTRSELESGETYYVRVRTFHEVNGTRYYSNWSGIKNCVVK